jgi:hypothetical protein
MLTDSSCVSYSVDKRLRMNSNFRKFPADLFIKRYQFNAKIVC